MTTTEIEAAVDAELAELRGGDKRSWVYRQAMIDVLQFRVNGVPIPARFEAGSVEFDAYMAGNGRGHALYWKLVKL